MVKRTLLRHGWYEAEGRWSNEDGILRSPEDALQIAQDRALDRRAELLLAAIISGAGDKVDREAVVKEAIALAKVLEEELENEDPRRSRGIAQALEERAQTLDNCTDDEWIGYRKGLRHAAAVARAEAESK